MFQASFCERSKSIKHKSINAFVFLYCTGVMLLQEIMQCIQWMLLRGKKIKERKIFKLDKVENSKQKGYILFMNLFFKHTQFQMCFCKFVSSKEIN